MVIKERILSLGLVAFMVAAMLYGLWRVKNGARAPAIRKIPALEALSEMIGRATEMGRPVHFTAGTGRLVDQNAPIMLASLDVLGKSAELCARYGSRLLVTASDPVYHAMCVDAVKTSFASSGDAEGFRSEDVRFLSDTQFAYAAGAIGLIEREKVAANVVVGSYGAEGLLLAEAGANAGAVQLAGTINMNILPFFVVACDYTLLGEEIYAAGAYLSGDGPRVSMLAAQDYAKVAVILAIVLGVVTFSVGSRAITNILDTFGK